MDESKINNYVNIKVGEIFDNLYKIFDIGRASGLYQLYDYMRIEQDENFANDNFRNILFNNTKQSDYLRDMIKISKTLNENNNSNNDEIFTETDKLISHTFSKLRNELMKRDDKLDLSNQELEICLDAVEKQCISYGHCYDGKQICPNCGTKNDDINRYCIHCGSRIGVIN